MTRIVGWHLNPEEHRCGCCYRRYAQFLLFDEKTFDTYDTCADCVGDAPDDVGNVLIPALVKMAERLEREAQEKSQPPRD